MASVPVHLVAVPFIVTGHINPLIHLCSKLIALGSFRITFINSIQNHKRMFKSLDPVTRDGIDFVAVSDGLPEKGPNEHHPAGMDGINELINSMAGMQPGVEKFVEDMVNQGVSVKGIIFDTFAHWIQDIANRFKLVRVAFSTTSATFDLVTLHTRRFRAEGFVPVNERTTGDKLIEFIPGMPSFSPYDLFLVWYDEHPIIDFFAPYERLLEADWILSGTFQELEPDRISTFHNHYGFKNYLPIGPFLPDEHILGSGKSDSGPKTFSSPDEARCLEWLDSQPDSSVLYVAFGSIAVMPVDQFQELVLALDRCAKNSINILWAVRTNFVVDGDFPQELFDEFVNKNGEKVCVVPWAPQMEVLRHKAVSGFMTHCGWNSTLEAICAGVPMIGWPCMSEQNMNCSFLFKMNLVLRLKDHSVDGIVGREKIYNAVEALMNGEPAGKEIRSKVAEMKVAARKAVATGGSSQKNLEAFVKALKA